MRWQLNGLASLHWHRWDDEWVIFDEGSGQTFLTDTLTAASLMVLENGATTLAELGARVAEDLPSIGRQELAALIGDSLEFLVSLGLVERLPS